MDRINTVNMAAGHKFQDANPSIAQYATSLDAEWFNGVQEEAVGIIEADGQTPTAGTYDQLLKALVNLAHPVGSTLFMHNDSFNPNTKWNWTTWTELEGVVLVGRDTGQVEFAATGDTGGEKAHTLTVDELPAHHHDLPANLVPNNVTPSSSTGDGVTAGASTTGDTGGGQSHNNLQPYLVVRMWKRTA